VLEGFYLHETGRNRSPESFPFRLSIDWRNDMSGGLANAPKNRLMPVVVQRIGIRPGNRN